MLFFVWWKLKKYCIFTKTKTNKMTLTQQIENLKSQKNSVRTNRELNNIEKKIMKLAKMFNAQNHFLRYTIYDGNVYGLEINPDY